MLDALIGPLVDFIINRVSDSNTSIQTILLGFISISLLSTLNSFWKYLTTNRKSIIYRLQGKHTINDLEKEAKNIREKIIKAQEKLRQSGDTFDAQVDRATGVVRRLQIISKDSARQDQRKAVNKVASLKEVSREQRIKMQDLLTEMLANSSEAEKWFATREKRVSSVARKHSPLRKEKK